jgi:hypothetical protein
LLPTDADAAALLADIDTQESRAREQEQREQDRRRRAGAAAPVLALAREAEVRQDLIRAGWLAENALALDPDCADAQQIVERARARLFAEPDLADETIRVQDGATPLADPEATLMLAPAPSFGRRVANTLKQWSQHVSTLGAGLRASNQARVKRP